MPPPSSPSIPTMQPSAFSFTDMLMDRNDFMMSGNATGVGVTGALPTPHMDATPLAPLLPTFGSGYGTGAPIPLAGQESPAYTRLRQLCQQSDTRLRQVTHDYESLRVTHEELVRSHGRLLEAHLETSKKLQAREVEPIQRSTQASEDPQTDPGSAGSRHPSWGLVPSEFPLVKYWRRRAWRTHDDEGKDSTVLASSSGQRGGARAAKGENVMMQYIENADGTPITGDVAADMRSFARSLWVELNTRHIAPPKWGDASMTIRENFHFEMESKFYVLRLCDNHWKSQAIATAIYSQWHGRFVTGQVTSKKRAVKSEDDPNEEPAAKRHRAAKSDPSPGPTSDCESNDGDAASMPKAIIPIDPLADVFDTLDATPFAVLNRVPEEIPPPTPVSSVAKLPGNSNPGGTQAVGRGTSPPLSSDSMAPEPGPSLVAPTTPSPAIETPTRPSSGTPPPSPPAIEPHIPGSTGTQISPGTPADLRPAPAPPPNASLVPPSTSDASHSSSTMPSSGTGEEKKTSKTPKKYTGKGKMIPGGAITARNICARDWCVSHPEGTKGEFARHWDTLDPGSKAAYKHKETDAKALAKGKSTGRS
ncbi:hypothetical protein EDB85DRAFT_1892326 [Lactarius pseudohatsudake]|nr:hypothetical protein EDB85DRAFT_1892326 [Lactarius pseudohatsudake]